MTNHDTVLDYWMDTVHEWNTPEGVMKFALMLTPDEYMRQGVDIEDVLKNYKIADPKGYEGSFTYHQHCMALMQRAEMYWMDSDIEKFVIESADTFPSKWQVSINSFITRYGFLYFDGGHYTSPFFDAQLKAMLWSCEKDYWSIAFIFSMNRAKAGVRMTHPFTFISGAYEEVDLSKMNNNMSWDWETAEDVRGLGRKRFKIAFSALEFMSQKILQPVKGQASRSCRKRARNLDHIPDINIIKLRAYEQRLKKYKDSQSIDWQHRWVVRGHWRNQWYPANEEHRTIWIKEHIKGPEGKALLAKKNIFKVVR